MRLNMSRLTCTKICGLIMTIRERNSTVKTMWRYSGSQLKDLSRYGTTSKTPEIRN